MTKRITSTTDAKIYLVSTQMRKGHKISASALLIFHHEMSSCKLGWVISGRRRCGSRGQTFDLFLASRQNTFTDGLFSAIRSASPGSSDSSYEAGAACMHACMLGGGGKAGHCSVARSRQNTYQDTAKCDSVAATRYQSRHPILNPGPTVATRSVFASFVDGGPALSNW